MNSAIVFPAFCCAHRAGLCHVDSVALVAWSVASKNTRIQAQQEAELRVRAKCCVAQWIFKDVLAATSHVRKIFASDDTLNAMAQWYSGGWLEMLHERDCARKKPSVSPYDIFDDNGRIADGFGSLDAFGHISETVFIWDVMCDGACVWSGIVPACQAGKSPNNYMLPGRGSSVVWHARPDLPETCGDLRVDVCAGAEDMSLPPRFLLSADATDHHTWTLKASLMMRSVREVFLGCIDISPRMVASKFPLQDISAEVLDNGIAQLEYHCLRNVCLIREGPVIRVCVEPSVAFGVCAFRRRSRIHLDVKLVVDPISIHRLLVKCSQ